METGSRGCTSHDVIDEDEATVLKRIKDVIYLQRTSPNFAMYCVSHVTDRKHSFLFCNDDNVNQTAVDGGSKRKPAIRADQSYWARKRYVELLDDARQREHKSAKCEESGLEYHNSTDNNMEECGYAIKDNNNNNEEPSSNVSSSKEAITLFRRTWRVCSPGEAKELQQNNNNPYECNFSKENREALNANQTRYLTLHDIRHIWDGLCRICKCFATSRSNNPTWHSQPPPYNFISFNELTEFVEKTLHHVILQEKEKIIWFVEHITRVHLIHTEAILYTLVYMVEELLSFAREQWSCEDAKKRVQLHRYSDFNNWNSVRDSNSTIEKSEERHYDYEEAAGTVFYLLILLFDTHRKREAILQSTLQSVNSTPMLNNAMQNSQQYVECNSKTNYKNNTNTKNIYYQAAFEQYCVKAVEAVLYHYRQHQRRVKWQQTNFSSLNITTQAAANDKSASDNMNADLQSRSPSSSSSSSPLFDFVISVLESWRDEMSFSISTSCQLHEMY